MDEIETVVREMLALKDLQGVEAEVFEELVRDLTERLRTQINRAIILRLSDEQVERFDALMSAGHSLADLQHFVAACGVDAEATASEVVTAFVGGYLGT